MGEVVGQECGKKQQRVAFVLVDGLADVGIPLLGYRSPVEAAITPNLDAIASGGVNGLMDPVEPGLACGSDTAHLSLLGYNPRIYYRGRGAFESLGAGLAMVPGDIAFKVRVMCVDLPLGFCVEVTFVFGILGLSSFRNRRAWLVGWRISSS